MYSNSIINYLSFHQFECIRFEQVYFELFEMNYNEITDDIIRWLSDERNIWSSRLCIPVNGTEDFLDISSAAMGYNSSIPPGATNQPDTFPTRIS
jgi:hypothetical protein